MFTLDFRSTELHGTNRIYLQETGSKWGFHGRHNHLLENAPGFINVGLGLFNYPLYANSFMQPSFVLR